MSQVTSTPTTAIDDAPASGRPAYASIGSRHFGWIVALLCVVIVISNIGASKGVQIGPVITDGGFFLFPVAYILGDVVSEVYGFRASVRAIAMGFAAALLAVVCFAIIIALPGFNDEIARAQQQALQTALGPVWIIVAASLAGFAVGQTSNAAIMAWRKRTRGERGVVERLMTSTGVGEFLDTFIFCAIAASVIGITSLGQYLNYAFFGFLWKTMVEYACVPLTRLVIGWLKRHEPSYGAALAASTDH